MKKCWLCLRITPKDVVKALHDQELSTEEKHYYLTLMKRLIEYAYSKKPVYFCGKGKGRIIGGLLYIVGFSGSPADYRSKPSRLTQRAVAWDLPLEFSRFKKHTTETTVRSGFIDWLKILYKQIPEYPYYSEETEDFKKIIEDVSNT